VGDVTTVLVIGYNAFDVVVPVSGLPAPDTKSAVGEIHVGGGGPGATAAVAMARLGARVRLVTVLTDDLPGRLQRQELDDAGVDFSHSPVRCGQRSAKAVILVDEGTAERTILWSRGDLPELSPDEVDPQWLDGVDLLYCDGHENVAAARLATTARQRGLPVVLDAGSVRTGTRALVPLCTDVVAAPSFAVALTGQTQPLAALRCLAALGPEQVAITFGAAGCLALRENRPVHFPAFDVPVRDTTGAGDTFHAGYAHARARGLGWRDCFIFGSAVAALKCRDWGGRRGLPERAEVERLLDAGRFRDEVPPQKMATGG